MNIEAMKRSFQSFLQALKAPPPQMWDGMVTRTVACLCPKCGNTITVDIDPKMFMIGRREADERSETAPGLAADNANVGSAASQRHGDSVSVYGTTDPTVGPRPPR